MRQILLQNETASLLQNVITVHYKMDQLLCYKMRQLLQNVSILLQNAIVIRKCDVKALLNGSNISFKITKMPCWISNN